MKKIQIPYQYKAGNIQIEQLHWPQLCPCCSDVTNENMYHLGSRIDLSKHSAEPIPGYVKSNRYHLVDWQVPYCSACISHAKKTEFLKLFITLTDIIIFILAVLYFAQSNHLLWLPLLVLALFLTDNALDKVIMPKLLKPMLKNTCVTHDYAIHAVTRKNHILLRIDDENYAHSFAELNDLKLE